MNPKQARIWPQRCIFVWLVSVSTLVVSASPELTASTKQGDRLRVSENHRYLVTADGKPFFWLADTAWELIHRLDRKETIHYLDTRRKQGFNVIQTVLLAELDGLNIPNRQGHRPLRDNNPLTPATQPGPDNDFWDDADWVLDRASERNMHVALLPAWGEWVTPRFARETIFSTPEQGYSYGHFLGNRWRHRSNLVWILGGDRQPTEKPHAMEVWRSMAEGIADGVNGEKQQDGAADWSTTLISYHSMTSSSKWWHDAPWLDFHCWGTYHSAKDYARSFRIAQADYNLPNPKPTLNSEPCYEAAPQDYNPENPIFAAAQIRRAAWWSVLSGCLGHTYGAHGVWMMSGAPKLEPKVPLPGLKPQDRFWPDPPLTWREAIQLPGATQLIHLRRFFESHGLEGFVPDSSLVVRESTEDMAPREDHVVAGRAPGWLAVYSPMGRAFTLSTSSEHWERYGQAFWLDPRVGTRIPIPHPGRGADARFSPPTNGDGNDWLLVIEASHHGRQNHKNRNDGP